MKLVFALGIMSVADTATALAFPTSLRQTRRAQRASSTNGAENTPGPTLSPLQAKTLSFLKERKLIGKNAKRRDSGGRSGGGEGGREDMGTTEKQRLEFSQEQGARLGAGLLEAMETFGADEREEKKRLKQKLLLQLEEKVARVEAHSTCLCLG